MVGLMRPYLMAASLIMLFLVFGIILDLVSPMLTRYLVDNVLPGSQDAVRKIGADPSLFRRLVIQLLMVVGILALVQILRMGVNIVNGRLGSRIGTAITFDMRGRLMAHLQQLSIGYYDRQQVGSLVGRVAYDTEALHGFVGQLTGGFLFQLLMVLFVGAMMFYINAKLAFFTLIPAPLVMAGSFVFWRHIYPRYYRFWDASSKQAGMISGTLSGIRVVKVSASTPPATTCARPAATWTWPQPPSTPSWALSFSSEAGSCGSSADGTCSAGR
jgi:ATP-binding cassette subfamily B protein